MQQNFDWVIMRINRRRQRLPVRFRCPDELRLGCILRDPSVKIPNRQTHVSEICEQDQEKSRVSATCPYESLPPFHLSGYLRSAIPPAFWQKVQLNGSRR